MKYEIFIDVMCSVRCKATVKRVLKQHGIIDALIVSDLVLFDKEINESEHKLSGVDLKKQEYEDALIVSNSVWIDKKMTIKEHELLGADLKKHGFVLHSHRKTFLVNETKRIIIRTVHSDKLQKINMNFSDFLSAILELDYTYLNNIFYEVTGTNISSFIFLQKVERAKVLLIYTKISLDKIAKRLGYSRSDKFSKMFKSVMKIIPKTYRRRYGKALGCVSKA